MMPLASICGAAKSFRFRSLNDAAIAGARRWPSQSTNRLSIPVIACGFYQPTTRRLSMALFHWYSPLSMANWQFSLCSLCLSLGKIVHFSFAIVRISVCICVEKSLARTDQLNFTLINCAAIYLEATFWNKKTIQ